MWRMVLDFDEQDRKLAGIIFNRDYSFEISKEQKNEKIRPSVKSFHQPTADFMNRHKLSQYK